MTFFAGKYESKLDAKGRLVLPSRIKSQLPEGSSELVIRIGFEQCLVLYPMVEFKKVLSKISGLGEFNKEYRKFQRDFFSGTAQVEMDGNGRFLIPKNMLSFAELEKDVVLVGIADKVEIWNPALYEKHLINDPGELSKLAEKYLNE